MIFGKSNEQDNATKQTKIKAMIGGMREYAWLPVKLANGRWVWLEHYYAYYHGGTNEDGTYFLWSASRDSYSPYSNNHLNPDFKHRSLSPVKR